MPRTFAEFVPPLLATLALLSSGNVVAGPPEGASGKMVLDKVSEGLRKYRKETDEDKRIYWLTKLAPSRDPRVALALWEAFAAWKPPVGGTMIYFPCEGHIAAICLVKFRYAPMLPGQSEYASLKQWWQANEADLRRRAAQLPQ